MTTHRFKPGQRVVVRGGEILVIRQLTLLGTSIPAYYINNQEGKVLDSDCESADFLNKYRYEKA